MSNKNPDVDRFMQMTINDIAFHLVVAHIGKTDAEWAEERDEFLDALRKGFDETRNKMRAEALASMLRNDEEEA